MSAPAHEAPPAAEQPTQPLPVSQTLPRGTNSWLMSSDSELLIVAIPVAAVGCGALFNTFVALTEAQGSNFAIVALVFVLVVLVGGAFLFARAVSRGGGGES